MAPQQLGEFGECLNCASLDFHDIFGFGSLDTLEPILFRDAFSNAEICGFCRLLTRVTRTFTPHQVVDHRNGEPVRFLLSPKHFQANLTELGSRYLEVVIFPPPSPLNVENRLAFHLIPISESLPGSLYHLLDHKQIDLGICRKWIAKCDGEHDNECTARTSAGRPGPETAFRLIDVVDECIVAPPPDARYITLSYVWGQFRSLELTSQNVQALSQRGSLFAQESAVAQTITDAMTVVKALGERYLWADQLCIIQDGSDKDLQIKSMDVIYGAALLTIVAADGDDANAGLPGVRPGTRTRDTRQMHEEVWPGLSLAATVESPLDPAGSVWGSRGWTFQEQLLSRRLLLFHQGGVLWQCRTALFCEDAPAAMKVDFAQTCWLRQLSPRWDRDDVPSLGVENEEDDSIETSLLRPAAFVAYAKAVKEYTKRRLTFPDDIIKAFEGISNRLNRHFGRAFLAALPESYLDVALLWTPVVLQTRRESHEARFPSWSWAGWAGQAEYVDAGPAGREQIELTSQWHVRDAQTPPRLANEVGIGIDEASLGRNISSTSFSWEPIFDVDGDYSGELSFTELPRAQGPYLQLCTSCSFFSIVHRSWSRPEALQINSSLKKPIEAHIHCITGSRRQLAGYLVLNGDGPDATTKGMHEFIVISGAQAVGFDPISGNVTYSDEALMYNVLLVEWDSAHQIASRLGVGRIFKEAWALSQPITRFVTLG